MVRSIYLIATVLLIALSRKFCDSKVRSVEARHLEAEVTSSSIDKGSLLGSRDGTLKSLAALLNSNSGLFQNWNGSQSNIEAFLEILQPWLVADIPRPISHLSNSIAGIDKDFKNLGAGNTIVNCADPKFSNVLTGQPLSQPRVIVDFIPFGYDVDKLLIRFYESYKTVDAFVIYECPYSLIGLKKPMYFQRARKAGLFQPFMDKVIYLSSTEKDVEPALNAMREAIARGDTKFGKGDLFGVELFMAKEMIILFKKFLQGTYQHGPREGLGAGAGAEAGAEAESRRLQTLRLIILDGLRDQKTISPLGIQNDGDEIVVKKALEHLKKCEIRPEVSSIYTPCMSFKSNFYWLQRTRDMDCFQGTDEVDRRIQKHLKKYMWRLGPYLWPLQSMLDANHNLRRVYHNKTCHHHMGLGTASHMSATNDPVEYWLKQCGTTENRYTCSKAVTKEIITAGKHKQITPELIFNSTIFPWCHKNNYAMHISNIGSKPTTPYYKEDTDLEASSGSILSSGTREAAGSSDGNNNNNDILIPSKKLALECIKGSIPWVVSKEPASFPFLMPYQDNPTAGLFKLCSTSTWANRCKDGVHRTKEGNVIEINEKALLFFPWSIDAL